MSAHRTDPPGSVVLLTGASAPLGRSVALTLADRGFAVLACDEKAAGLHDLSRETAAGGLIEIALGSTRDDAGCDALIAQAVEVFGRLDALVPATLATHRSPVEQTDEAAVSALFETNFRGPARLIRRALPLFRDAGRGKIVCVSSLAGRTPVPMSCMLSASHHALEGFCDALRIEVRAFGISVALIEPGLIEGLHFTASRGPTAATEDAYDGVRHVSNQALEDLIEDAVSPEDVAASVAEALAAPRGRARYPVSKRAARWLRGRKLLPTRAFDAKMARTRDEPKPTAKDGRKKKKRKSKNKSNDKQAAKKLKRGRIQRSGGTEAPRPRRAKRGRKA